MAQVFRRKWTNKEGIEQSSKVYYCRFQVGGKDYLRSTGKTKWADAKREMERMKADATDGRSIDRIIQQLGSTLSELPEEQLENARKDITEGMFKELDRLLSGLPAKEQETARRDFSKKLMHGIGNKLPIAETWEAWKQHPNTGTPAPKTLNGYQSQWQRFEKWVKKQDVVFLHEVNPALAEKYAADLWGSGVSPRTYNAHTKFLKSLFKTLRLQSSVEVNPFDGIKPRKNATESRRNFTTKELEAIWTKSEGDLHDLIVVGLCTGMRLGDAVCLKWESVDFENNKISYVPSKTRRTGKKVEVFMAEGLAPVIAERKKRINGKYVFPDYRDKYEHDASSVSKMFKTFLKETCGIEPNEAADAVDVQRKNAVARVGFHSLRHSFVSLLAANGVPQVVAQEMVGHGSPAMTAVYSHAGDEQKAQAIAKLPSFGAE
jgi:integrase